MPKSKARLLLYAWQHTLVDVSPFILPFILAGALGYSDAVAVKMVQAGLIEMMIATLMQTFICYRFSIMLGSTSTNISVMIIVCFITVIEMLRYSFNVVDF